MKNVSGKVAAITGAASGIGRELALRIAREGASLALADIRADGLEETADLARKEGAFVSAHEVDVSQRDAVERFALEASTAHGRIDLLINNAGVLLCESLEDVSYECFEWVMGVNFWGTVQVTKALLPHLKLRPEAHIVNMSSVAGLLTTPNNGPYAISKSAVKAFTETLGQELRGTRVRVSTVIAGGVKTGIFRRAPLFRPADPCMSAEETVAWYETAAATTPSNAAAAIVRGIKKNRRRILVGPDAHGIDLMARLAPCGAGVCAGWLMSNLRVTRVFRPKRLLARTNAEEITERTSDAADYSR